MQQMQELYGCLVSLFLSSLIADSRLRSSGRDLTVVGGLAKFDCIFDRGSILTNEIVKKKYRLCTK